MYEGLDETGVLALGAVEVAQGLAPVFMYEGLDETAELVLGAVEVAQVLAPVFK